MRLLITRWSTWIDAEVFYVGSFQTIKTVVVNLEDTSASDIKSNNSILIIGTLI